MKVAGIILIVIVIFAIRVGIRMAVRAGAGAAFGDGPQTPSCPYCGSSSVTQQGGHWDCDSCGKMF